VVVALLAVLLGGTQGAQAKEDGVEKSPRDMPIVVQPSAIAIPPLPEADQVRDLGWVRIAYPPSAHERVQPLLDEADDVKQELADELGKPVLAQPVEVRVARSPEEMVSLAPAEVPPPEYASAVAIPGLRLVLLSMRAPSSNEGTDLGELFRHELAHIALDDAVGSAHVPLWFQEGFAVHASGESPLRRQEALTNATLWKTIVPLRELDRSFPTDHYEVSVAYAEAADFVRFLLRQPDRARFAATVNRARRGEDFDHALTDAYGTDQRRLEYEWREELAKRYTFWPVLLSGSVVWVLVAVALGVGWMRKKKRDKATFARWEREEAEEAARRVAVKAVLTTEAPEPPPVLAARDPHHPSVPSVPMIEHDGSWHTLH
jgi:hypothetical protein